jgi:hypothetical protein
LTSLEKSDTPILDSGYSGFDSFWLNIEKGGNTRRFEVQVCLSTEKEKKNIKEKKNKRGWSPKPMLQKPDPLVSKIRTFGFSWTDLIWLGIEILFVLKRFSGIHVKELHHVAYKHIGRDRLTTMPIEFIQFY